MHEKLQPLAEGEHVDLDSGVTIVRGRNESGPLSKHEYRIRADGDSVVVSEEDIRYIAELSGFRGVKL